MPEKTVLINEDGEYDSTPTYLFDHPDLYKTAPHDAALTWFAEAHYGLGVDFGLYSLIGRGHDVMLQDNMPLAEYERLKNNFTAEHFDAVDMVEFAIANGMRYIDFTVRGEDGFCLYNTKVTDFNSANSPAHRDLLAELASVCEYHGIGLCLSYAHGTEWRHPHAPGTRAGTAPESSSLPQYLDFVAAQIDELLTQYGPIAAICLEGIDVARTVGQERIGCADLYRMIRILQPQVLVAYQQGFTGDEDFFITPESIPGKDAPADVQGHINRQPDKPAQILATLTPGVRGYCAGMAGQHRREASVWELLLRAGNQHTNLLVKSSLMPDGSLDLEDINTLLAVGQRIEHNGFPH